MNRMTLPLLKLGLALIALALTPFAHAAPPSDLPDTLRDDYRAPIVGPADDTAYAHGTLGLVRPSFGRASLYVAWRVMHLPAGAVATENHERLSDWVRGAEPRRGEDEVKAWLAERSGVEPQAPNVLPDYFRQRRVAIDGTADFNIVEGQCGPGAFALATRMLRELATDASLKPADRRAWVAGQDAVFARCTWLPGKTPGPPLPAALPASAPAKLKALNAYQRAAALFYGDEFVAARQAFDAIAAVPGHPMRPWATLGALRSLVRDAVRDADWDAAVADAWTRRQLRGAEFTAAVAEAAARSRARRDAAVKEIGARARAAKSDATLSPVHAAIDYTVRRALTQLAPLGPLRVAMDVLDRVAENPYANGALDLFQQLYPKVAPDRPQGPAAGVLRGHAWFDFIVAVQACSDAPRAVDAAACDDEHAHALARWEATKDNAWLLATLMTARQPSAAHLPAVEAARGVAEERPEWASLQLYAARVLRALGRGADARAAVEALAASPAVHKRDRVLLDAELPGVTRRITPPITETQMRAEYDKILRLGRRTEYRVRQVMTPTRDQALAVLERLHRGEPFEVVATEVSVDSGSRAKGGDLGWNLASGFPPAFGEAVKRLAPRGRVVLPVQTPFGWHVIEVTDSRPELMPPFEDVRERIRERLQRKAQEPDR